VHDSLPTGERESNSVIIFPVLTRLKAVRIEEIPKFPLQVEESVVIYVTVLVRKLMRTGPL